MMDALWAWAQSDPRMVIALAGIAAFCLCAAYLYRDKWLPIGGGSGSVPTRRQVLDNLDANFRYFESVGCKEGMEACETEVIHAFHEHQPLALPSPGEQVSKILIALEDALKKKQSAAAIPGETHE